MLTSPQRRAVKYKQGECYRLSGADRTVDDLTPIEDIGFGYGVVRSQSIAGGARLVNMNSYEGVLDADLVSGDVVTLVGYTVDPNGVQDAFNISVTYASSFASTAAAIETAIEAAATNVAVTRSANNRTFTMVASNDKRIVVTTPFTVTSGGSGTAEFTNTKGTTDSLRGISERNRNASVPVNTDNAVPNPVWPANKREMPVIYRGDPAVPVGGTVTVGGSVYVLLEDYTDSNSVLNKRGSFRNNTDGDLAPVALVSSAEFSSTKDNGLAPVSILKV